MNFLKLITPEAIVKKLDTVISGHEKNYIFKNLGESLFQKLTASGERKSHIQPQFHELTFLLTENSCKISYFNNRFKKYFKICQLVLKMVHQSLINQAFQNYEQSSSIKLKNGIKF